VIIEYLEMRILDQTLLRDRLASNCSFPFALFAREPAWLPDTARNQADTSSKHTLAAWGSCRLVRRVCRYIIYDWPRAGCLFGAGGATWT
jgi:hypothetical protein